MFTPSGTDARHTTPDLTDTDLAHWLALLRVPGIGPRRFQQLLGLFGDPQTVLSAGPSRWQAAGIPARLQQALADPSWQQVEQDLAWLEHPGHHLLCFTDPLYPPLLQEIPDPPPMLFIQGEPAALSRPQLAAVGSRNPSAGGRQAAFDFAHYLSQAGLLITSGLAMGIDTASHQGALQAGQATLAVAGTGLDQVYPAKNRDLASKIRENGAIISEFPPGTPAKPDHFPRRNRIISGLSLGTLVVEAAARSGSLITARLAAEQGREVFAMPGSIHNPLARGCHHLIRQGAKLVETASDILEELGPLAQWSLAAVDPVAGEAVRDLNPPQHTLLEHLGYEPVSIDEVVERSGLTADEVSSILLVLELHGYVQSTHGGRYCRIR